MTCIRLRGSTIVVTALMTIAVRHAATHVLHSRPLDDKDDPRRWLLIGMDPAGRLLELVMLVYDDGYELIIHAMKARSQYLDEF